MTDIKNLIISNWIVILVVFSCIIAAYGSVLIWGKDNPVEQEAEVVIKDETGLAIDLTP